MKATYRGGLSSCPGEEKNLAGQRIAGRNTMQESGSFTCFGIHPVLGGLREPLSSITIANPHADSVPCCTTPCLTQGAEMLFVTAGRQRFEWRDGEPAVPISVSPARSCILAEAFSLLPGELIDFPEDHNPEQSLQTCRQHHTNESLRQ